MNEEELKKLSEEELKILSEMIEKKKKKENNKLPKILKWAIVMFVLQILTVSGQMVEVYLNEGKALFQSWVYATAYSLGSHIFLVIGFILCFKYYKDSQED